MSVSILFTLLISSCTQKEELGVETTQVINQNMFNKDYIIEAELTEQLDYRTFHLTQLVNSLKKSKVNFDKQFSKKTGKDNDFNQLFFTDLLTSNAIDNKSGILDASTKYSLEAFYGVDTQDLLPYIEKIKDGDSSNPLFLISSYDVVKEMENVLAFEFDTNGELQLIDSDIDEEEVFDNTTSKQSRAVYKVDSDGCGNYYKNANGCGGGGTGGGTTSSSVAVRQMKIKDKKDSWVNNANIRLMRVGTGSMRDPNSNNSYSYCGINQGNSCEYRGTWIAQYNNSEIRNGRVVNVNQYLALGSGSIAMYAIFEYDNWPAPNKNYTRYYNGAKFSLEFKSYQTPYDFNVFTTYSGNPHGIRSRNSGSLNNRDIEYNYN